MTHAYYYFFIAGFLSGAVVGAISMSILVIARRNEEQHDNCSRCLRGDK